MNINELIINRPDGNCLGDCWTNDKINIIFKDIDLQNDKRFLVDKIFNYIKFLKDNSHNGWLHENITKSESKKLNSIMKCKTKETLKKKLIRFYWEIQEDMYDHLFNRKKIEAWQDVLIDIQTKEHLWNSGEKLMGVVVK